MSRLELKELFKEGAQDIYWKLSPYMVLDFETTGTATLDPKTDILLACWYIVHADGRVEKKHRFGNELELKELTDDLDKCAFVVAHNAKFELQFLKRCGVELRDVVCYCTMLGQWVLDGNLAKPKDLNGLSVRYGLGSKFDIASKYFDAGLTAADIPREWLLSYCYQDVELTYNLFTKQLEKVRELNLLHIVYMRNLTCACLADIEFNGMTLDKSRVYDEYTKLTEELTATETELNLTAEGVNLGSGKQLAVFLYESLKFTPPKDRKGKVIKTAGGALSTAAGTMAMLVAKTQEQERFLELYKKYNRLKSLLEKNLTFFKGVVDERGGKFHAVFNQGVTKTHRLSSSGIPIKFEGAEQNKSVQFQNLPREYKRLFTASREGRRVIEGDGSQLEFRVASELCDDILAKVEIDEGTDIHANTKDALAARGFTVDRQGAKGYTFKPLINIAA